MKKKYMVQKLISVINCFLLFRHVKPLVNGLSMSTRLKNKPGPCLNCTKSLSTSQSPFVVVVVLSTVCQAVTLVVIQVSQLCIHNLKEEIAAIKM